MSAKLTWNYMERLLVDECGLLRDQGLEQQRPNLINAIKNSHIDPQVRVAAHELLKNGGLHKIRVGKQLMTREQVANALLTEGQ